MATTQIMQRKQLDMALSSPLLDPRNGDTAKSRGLLLEKKIDYLESLAGKVSRRSRKWLNDRLLMELVPRLNAEEIRGLFAPPPWGEDVLASAFCMNSMGVWDKFSNEDLEIEVDIFNPPETSCTRKKGRVDSDQMTVLNAWHRIDNRTREALQRSYLTELIDNYESCIRAFIVENQDETELVLEVQDPFHRLLLHGVCEFYNLESVTVSHSDEKRCLKMTKIKKKTITLGLPNITLCQFLKMSKEGTQ